VPEELLNQPPVPVSDGGSQHGLSEATQAVAVPVDAETIGTAKGGAPMFTDPGFGNKGSGKDGDVVVSPTEHVEEV
jgi:hypothetical protein